MTLNHIKTWPVGTMAVVQLRVNLEEEVQDFYVNNIPSSHYEDVLHPRPSQENGDLESGPVLPLSRKHLELFTKMSSHPHKTVRTDTVSTILEQDEFDSELQSSTVFNQTNNISDTISDRYERFHVLALTRVEDEIRYTRNCNSVGRRPSNKVDNWDLIYTEAAESKFTRNFNENDAANAKSKNNMCNKQHECLLPDIPLDARKATTLRRHYYPEGGWGWVIIVCAVLLNVVNHGLQLSCAQLTRPAADKFHVHAGDFAGKSEMHAQVFLAKKWFWFGESNLRSEIELHWENAR
ncbi:uncharacterized protein LOC116163924 [Photinus pyralis]|uniref:uncharacterized protein LOC116163924 n=1 Tax=Photinus pyralis TaxID=7054 RepID=UPI0012677130|nr:uncharacterized protein LOC116163924 [Photinus pyralis]